MIFQAFSPTAIFSKTIRDERADSRDDSILTPSRFEHADGGDLHRRMLIPRPARKHVRRARPLLVKDEVAAGTAPEQTIAYDCNGEYGLTCAKTNPLNQQDTLTYDADGNLASETFTDTTPARSFGYDPDGHPTSLISSTLGTASRTYDANGRLATASDSSRELDPGITTYGYYGDGLRASLSLSVPVLSFSQSNLFTYSYRPDGERSSLVSALGSDERHRRRNLRVELY